MRRVVVVHGGSELYGSDLACLWTLQGAIRRGWSVDLVIPRAGLLADAAGAAGARVHLVDPVPLRRSDLGTARALLGPARWTGELARLRSVVRAAPVDLVHVSTLPALGGWWAARFARAPMIWSAHELLGSAAVIRLYEAVLRRAQVVTCCSEAVVEQFGGPTRSRCRVVHTGAAVSPGVRPTEPLSGPTATIACVARINRWKGQDVLVEATARLVRSGRPVTLVLVGGGFGADSRPLDRLRELIDGLGLEDVVALAGERRDALGIVARSDIFVLPSRTPEPFGIALVEAMALGRPCVATAAGGPLEIVTDGRDGLLVAPGDAGALADAIERLLSDPGGARAMGRRAAERARDFTADRMVAQMLDLYDEVAAAGS